jgi:hypothetical protein
MTLMSSHLPPEPCGGPAPCRPLRPLVRGPNLARCWPCPAVLGGCKRAFDTTGEVSRRGGASMHRGATSPGTPTGSRSSPAVSASRMPVAPGPRSPSPRRRGGRMAGARWRAARAHWVGGRAGPREGVRSAAALACRTRFRNVWSRPFSATPLTRWNTRSMMVLTTDGPAPARSPCRRRSPVLAAPGGTRTRSHFGLRTSDWSMTYPFPSPRRSGPARPLLSHSICPTPRRENSPETGPIAPKVPPVAVQIRRLCP